MEPATSELAAINLKMSLLRKQVVSLQERIDDIKFSEDDAAALEEYLEEKANGTLYTQEDVDQAFASR